MIELCCPECDFPQKFDETQEIGILVECHNCRTSLILESEEICELPFFFLETDDEV